MTVMLDLSPDEEASLRAQAQTRGLSVQQWLFRLAKQAAPLPPSREEAAQGGNGSAAQKDDFKEWERKFDAWVGSHDPNTPVLSDEAISRESIYPDRS